MYQGSTISRKIPKPTRLAAPRSHARVAGKKMAVKITPPKGQSAPCRPLLRVPKARKTQKSQYHLAKRILEGVSGAPEGLKKAKRASTRHPESSRRKKRQERFWLQNLPKNTCSDHGAQDKRGCQAQPFAAQPPHDQKDEAPPSRQSRGKRVDVSQIHSSRILKSNRAATSKPAEAFRFSKSRYWWDQANRPERASLAPRRHIAPQSNSI